MINKDIGDVAEKDYKEENAPLAKRRVLLYALTPIALLALLTGGLRLASVVAEQQNTRNEAREQAEWKAVTDRLPAPGRPMLPPMQVRDADKQTQQTIESTVRGQVMAIHAGDYAKALGFAVPGFRSQMTPERFSSLIRGNYAPLIEAEKVSVKKAKILGMSGKEQRATVEAAVRVGNGKDAYYTYMMIGQEGEWMVQGVVPHPAPSVPPRRNTAMQKGSMRRIVPPEAIVSE